jgi:hypothetical protein
MSETGTADQMVIELSRKKIALAILGACIFVAIGIGMVSLDGRNPTFIHGVGILSILFLGFCAILGLPRLFSKKHGLVFSAAGIFDNASGVAGGFIPWSEITGVKIFEMQKQKFMVLGVKDPQKYIGRGSWLKRAAISANYKMCGSPITISAITLQASFTELLSIFNLYYQRYGYPQEGGVPMRPFG